MAGLAQSLADTGRWSRAVALLGWSLVIVALGGGAGLVAQHPRYALDAVLVAIALAIFAWRPFPALLFVVGVGFKESPLVSILTLIAGGLTVVFRARSLRGWVVWLPWLILLGLASYRLPLHPIADEGTRPANLTLPLFGSAYLPEPSNALLGWWRLASLLVLFLLAAWLVTDTRRLRAVAAAVVVGAIYPVLDGLNQLAAGTYTVRNGFNAVEGPFNFPNAYAFFLTGTLLVGVILVIELRSTRWRVAAAALLLGTATCLIFTYTRGAWIGFSIGFLVICLLSYRRLVFIGLIALGLAAFAFPKQVDKVQERFSDLSGRQAATAKNSYEWRKGEWSAMYDRFGYDKPWTGHGFGTYPSLTVVQFGTQGNRYATLSPSSKPGGSPSRGFTAHNDYLRLLVELGVTGVLLWAATLLGIIGATLNAARQPAVRPYAAAVVGNVVAIAVMSYADNLLAYTAALAIPIALAGAVVGAATHRGDGPVRSRRGSGG